MIYLFLALTATCVLSATAAVVSSVRSSRLTERWKDSMRKYFEKCMEDVQSVSEAYTDEKIKSVPGLWEDVDHLRGRVNELIHEIRAFRSEVNSARETSGITANDFHRKIEDIRKQIDDLKLDYREAQNAANHINDYAAGLEKIFNYDPLDALKRSRNGSGEP